MRRSLALAGALCVGLAGAALAHNGVEHKSAAEAAAHARVEAGGAVKPETPLPFAVGGAYALIDQNGAPRTERDPNGRAQLVFFGYASCQAICSVVTPRMAEAAALLEAKDVLVTPVLITVDPTRDTPDAMKPALERLHPRFVGLTGAPDALATAMKAFQVESKEVAKDADGGAIFAHGSFVYLMDAEGGFLTIMPPILSPERMAEIAAGYL